VHGNFKASGELLVHVDGEVSGLKKRVGGLGSGFNKLENKFDVMSDDINILKTEVTLIRHNQITRDEFKLLETRVTRLEKKVLR